MAAARAARTHARAEYSRFLVGAALEADDGTMLTGCNIESASYGLTMCAERVAIFSAVSAGYRRFTRLVVVADTAQPTPPCGACRQVLWELAGDIEVTLANLSQVFETIQLRKLLPLPFDGTTLKNEERSTKNEGRNEER